MVDHQMVDRVLVGYHRELSTDLQAVAAILYQQVQYIRDFEGYVLTMEWFFIGLGNASGMSWLFR